MKKNILFIIYSLIVIAGVASLSRLIYGLSKDPQGSMLLMNTYRIGTACLIVSFYILARKFKLNHGILFVILFYLAFSANCYDLITKLGIPLPHKMSFILLNQSNFALSILIFDLADWFISSFKPSQIKGK